MELSKEDCASLLAVLTEYATLGHDNQKLDDLRMRLKRAEDLPAKTDKFVWVLDAICGIVFNVEIPANFTDNGVYEDFLEANLPNDIRLKDCNWMVGEAGVVTIHRDRYVLGF